MKSKKASYQSLLNRVSILEASTLINFVQSKSNLNKLSESSFMASGLVVEIKDLSGNIKAKFMVPDGFNPETIVALQLELDKAISLQAAHIKK